MYTIGVTATYAFIKQEAHWARNEARCCGFNSFQLKIRERFFMGKQKFTSQSDLKLAVIGDEDTVAGFALAGIGQRDGSGTTNFLVVDAKTRRADVEDAFRCFTGRRDIGIILINQHICDDIRHLMKDYNSSGQTIPTILEIPSVDHPYDPSKDSIMQRVQVFFGSNVSG